MNLNQPVIDLTTLKPRQKGRAAPLPTFTFKSKGITVQIKKVGPFTMDAIRKKLLKERQRPEPPVITVEIGEARTKMQEINRADPNWLAAVSEYNQWLQETAGNELLNIMTHYSIVLPKWELDTDSEEYQEFQEIVEDKRFLMNLVDPGSTETIEDKYIYIQHYLFEDAEEMQACQVFITGQSMPTEEAVQEHIDSFPDNVQEQEPVRTPGVPIGL